jgi:hypothetical protein
VISDNIITAPAHICRCIFTYVLQFNRCAMHPAYDHYLPCSSIPHDLASSGFPAKLLSVAYPYAHAVHTVFPFHLLPLLSDQRNSERVQTRKFIIMLQQKGMVLNWQKFQTHVFLVRAWLIFGAVCVSPWHMGSVSWYCNAPRSVCVSAPELPDPLRALTWTDIGEILTQLLSGRRKYS